MVGQPVLKIMIKKETIIFYSLVGITIIGASFIACLIGNMISTGGGSANSTPAEREIKEDIIINQALDELEGMDLLDLVDLKDRLQNLKTDWASDFEISTSGILDVFK